MNALLPGATVYALLTFFILPQFLAWPWNGGTFIPSGSSINSQSNLPQICPQANLIQLFPIKVLFACDFKMLMVKNNQHNHHP